MRNSISTSGCSALAPKYWRISGVCWTSPGDGRGAGVGFIAGSGVVWAFARVRRDRVASRRRCRVRAGHGRRSRQSTGIRSRPACTGRPLGRRLAAARRATGPRGSACRRGGTRHRRGLRFPVVTKSLRLSAGPVAQHAYCGSRRRRISLRLMFAPSFPQQGACRKPPILDKALPCRRQPIILVDATSPGSACCFPPRCCCCLRARRRRRPWRRIRARCARSRSSASPPARPWSSPDGSSRRTRRRWASASAGA